MPSLNTGNAILSNPIKVDSSYNVGIGGAASGSFKLNVTGSGNFTGALSGTSATFSSNVTAQTGEFISAGQEGATGSVVRISTTSVNAAARNWGIVNTWDNFGDLTFRVSNAQGGNALSAGATRMVILSSGNVGIGTTSPSQKLDINVGSSTNGANGLLNFQWGSGANQNMGIYWQNSSSYSIVRQSDGAGNLRADLYINSGGNINLLPTGNVGIGTSSPSDFGSTYTTLCIDNATNGGVLDLRKNGVRGLTIAVDQNEPRIEARVSGQPLVFYTNNGGTIGARLTIASTGVSTFSSSVAVGDSVSLLGELYWGPFSSGQKIRAYPTGSSGSATLNYAFWDGSSWVIQATLTSAGVWSTTGGGTSDARTKEEIDYNFDNGIESILKLQPTKFKFKIAPNKQRRGFIAQDVLEVIPDLVLGDGEKEDGTYGLDYDGILALAVKAIQEMNQTIQNQQQQINSLINR
jgi:hypothetical protein